MDCENLLERENEFKKLNRQLEKKTEILMKEIENAMAKKDIFLDFSCNLKLSPRYSNTKHHCDSSSKGSSESKTPTPKRTVNKQNATKKTKYNSVDIDKSSDLQTQYIDGKSCQYCTITPNHMNRDLEFLYAFVSVNVKDHILPQLFMKENINVESVCKYLAAKIKLLQEQVEKLKQNINVKSRECSQHMRQLADLESSRLELQSAAHGARAGAADARAKCQLLQNKLDEKDRQLREQRSSSEAVGGELKKLRSRCSGLEARAAAHEDLVASLKQQIQTAKCAEKEYRESARAASSCARAAAAQQEKRTRELQATVDRQARLVTNLRRQLALTTASGALAALEKDYNDFLTQEY